MAAPQPKQKHRFCATWPHVSRCRHGQNCAFAHSREEITAPLLTPEEESYVPAAMTDEFFTQKFKTMWCPIGAQHDWQACMYAHTYQDARRPPSIGYGHQLCPFWNKKDTSLAYAQRCPLGPRCPHAHGAKEQLYHPRYFRTLVCRDLQRGRCPRGDLCAFFHKPSDKRPVPEPDVDYTVPLPKESLEQEWLDSFLNPPRFQESGGDDAPGMMPAGVPSLGSLMSPLTQIGMPTGYPAMMLQSPIKWRSAPGGFDEALNQGGMDGGRKDRQFEGFPMGQTPDSPSWGPMSAPTGMTAWMGVYEGLDSGYPGSYTDSGAQYGYNKWG